MKILESFRKQSYFLDIYCRSTIFSRFRKCLRSPYTVVLLELFPKAHCLHFWLKQWLGTSKQWISLEMSWANFHCNAAISYPPFYVSCPPNNGHIATIDSLKINSPNHHINQLVKNQNVVKTRKFCWFFSSLCVKVIPACQHRFLTEDRVLVLRK